MHGDSTDEACLSGVLLACKKEGVDWQKIHRRMERDMRDKPDGYPGIADTWFEVEGDTIKINTQGKVQSKLFFRKIAAYLLS